MNYSNRDIGDIKKKAIDDYKKSQTALMLEFAKQMQSISLEGMKSKNKTKFYKKYTVEQVETYLANPAQYETQLRDISRYLLSSSSQYWRLVNYFPTIAVLCPILVPFNTEKLKKNLNKALKQFNSCSKILDNMNVWHEYLKVLLVATREDVFYGYEIETEDSYYIKQLNPEYCRIKGVYDGCLTYEFDFSYFKAYKDELEEYTLFIDKEFMQKYNLYEKDSTNFRWQELNLEKEICIKFEETIDYCCPPYVNVFDDLYDISDYKDLNKAKVEMDNTRYIGFTMETKGKDSQRLDDWILDVETMKDYFAFAQASLGGIVGSFMSPMPFKEIEFSQNKTEIDNVSNAINNYWEGTGVARVLMGQNTTAGTLKYSIKTDEGILFKLYRQIERILSRKIKKASGGLYEVMLPDLTLFNLQEEFDKYLKASEYGFQGAKTLAGATLGLTQNRMEGLGFMENEMLKMTDNMIPVQSSHTQSNEEGGSPAEKDDGEVSDSSQKTRDNSSNENR